MRSLNVVVITAVIVSILLCPIVSLAGMNRTTDDKLFRVDLQPEPAQPVVGSNAAILTVSDARSGQMIDDAVIEVVPWMTMHSHGSPKKPSVNRTEHGRYEVNNIFYTMEGDWDLIVTIQQKGAKDTATFTITNVKMK